jgi:hypothetical protein
METLLGLAHRWWRPRLETPVPGPGPAHRSTDIAMERDGHLVLIEVETRVQSLEGIIRECVDKRSVVAAARPRLRVHAVLCVPATRHHRRLVSAHPRIVASAFPVPSADLRAALVGGEGPWPGDGILWQG